MTAEKGYQKLKVFREADKLVLLIYQITKKFPREEMFGLVSQMRRAAVSIVANIIEGQVRESNKGFLRFLFIANGSLVELEYYIDLALKLSFINKEEHEKLDEQRRTVGVLLNGLIKSLKENR